MSEEAKRVDQECPRSERDPGRAVTDVLYATCGDKVYSRKVKVKGANAFEKPFLPGKPRL